MSLVGAERIGVGAGFARSGGKMHIFSRLLNWPKETSDLRENPDT